MALIFALAGALLIYGLFQISRVLIRLLIIGIRWASIELRIFTRELEDEYVGGLAAVLAMLICVYVLLRL